MPEEARAGFSADFVRQVAESAGLELDQGRAAVLAPQLQAIREDIGRLGSINLTDVEPLMFPARQERQGER